MFSMWILHFVLEFYYLSTLIGQPEPKLGKIYPLYNHGQVVYLTQLQHEFIGSSFWLAIGLFVIGAALTLYIKDYNRG